MQWKSIYDNKRTQYSLLKQGFMLKVWGVAIPGDFCKGCNTCRHGENPDFIIGNYSDGNLVASLMSHALGVTQCNIAHALEKTKYNDADINWWGLACTATVVTNIKYLVKFCKQLNTFVHRQLLRECMPYWSVEQLYWFWMTKKIDFTTMRPRAGWDFQECTDCMQELWHHVVLIQFLHIC